MQVASLLHAKFIDEYIEPYIVNILSYVQAYPNQFHRVEASVGDSIKCYVDKLGHPNWNNKETKYLFWLTGLCKMQIDGNKWFSMMRPHYGWGGHNYRNNNVFSTIDWWC